MSAYSYMFLKNQRLYGLYKEINKMKPLKQMYSAGKRNAKLQFTFWRKCLELSTYLIHWVYIYSAVDLSFQAVVLSSATNQRKDLQFTLLPKFRCINHVKETLSKRSLLAGHSDFQTSFLSKSRLLGTLILLQPLRSMLHFHQHQTVQHIKLS